MNGTLVNLDGGPPIPLVKTKILIGRRPDCDITLPYANVSGRHCELRYDDGGWDLADLDSSNGVKVNGNKVKKLRLMPGDQICIARHYNFRIEFTLQGAGRTEPVAPKEQKSGFGQSLLEMAGLGKSADLGPSDDEEEEDTNSRRYKVDED